MVEKSDDDLILELEGLLARGGRPTKEEKESVTLRISAPLARQVKIAYPDERSRIYEEALIRELRKDGLLPPPLDGKPEPSNFSVRKRDVTKELSEAARKKPTPKPKLGKDD